MRLRLGASLGIALSAAFVSSEATAGQEGRLVGDVAHVRVDSKGLATVEHHMQWRLAHGTFRSLDLTGIDENAVVDPAATIRTEDGHELTAPVVRGDPSTVRVVLDSRQGLRPGVATVDVRWQIDLVAAHALVPDGSSWRLTWSLPTAPNGFELPRIVLDLPAAPSPPRSLGADPDQPSSSAEETATRRREGDREILEIVRPYVAHGETLSGAVRLDPRALPDVVDDSLRPRADASVSSPQPPFGDGRFVILTAPAFALCALLAWRERAFARACDGLAEGPYGLVALPWAVRAVLASAIWAGGVALQTVGRPILASLFISASVVLSALRAPRIKTAIRGPGRWFPIRQVDILDPHPIRSWLMGIWPETLCTVGVVVAAWAASRVSSEELCHVLLDSAPLVAAFATGRKSQRVSIDIARAARLLRKSYLRLRRTKTAQVVLWGRVGLDGTIDEVRVRVAPQQAIPGVLGIEMGHAWSRTLVGWVASPEVLIRVLDGSAAAARMCKAFPAVRPMQGRRPREQALRMMPTVSTTSACETLVYLITDVLKDRRQETAPYRLRERRKLDEPASGRECLRSIAEVAC